MSVGDLQQEIDAATQAIIEAVVDGNDGSLSEAIDRRAQLVQRLKHASQAAGEASTQQAGRFLAERTDDAVLVLERLRSQVKDALTELRGSGKAVRAYRHASTGPSSLNING